MEYFIKLPNDFGSELAADFPNLEGDDLTVVALERICSLWPGLEFVGALDSGFLGAAPTPPPDSMPSWAKISPAPEEEYGFRYVGLPSSYPLF